MVHGKNRISVTAMDGDLKLVAGPDVMRPGAFGLPFEPEDSQYGPQVKVCTPEAAKLTGR